MPQSTHPLMTVSPSVHATLCRLLRGAYVAGPALMLAGALAFVAGIGINPRRDTSWVEGILCAYGIALFVPIYLDLSARLMHSAPRLGRVTLFTGLFGATAGFGHEMARPFEFALRTHGMSEGTWNAFLAAPGPEFLSVALLGPLFPLTSILLGVGFWRARTFPRWIPAALTGAGIGFPLAQALGLDWALAITYPGACVLWFAAFTGVALRDAHAPTVHLHPTVEAA